MTAEPALLEPIEQEAADLSAQDRRVFEGEKQAFDGVEHDPLGADVRDREFEAQKQAFEIVIADLGEIRRRIDRDVLDVDLLVGDEPIEAEADEATLSTMSPGRSSNVTKMPARPRTAPLMRKVEANRVLPQPAEPHTRVGRPRGSPPLSDRRIPRYPSAPSRFRPSRCPA